VLCGKVAWSLRYLYIFLAAGLRVISFSNSSLSLSVRPLRCFSYPRLSIPSHILSHIRPLWFSPYFSSIPCRPLSPPVAPVASLPKGFLRCECSDSYAQVGESPRSHNGRRTRVIIPPQLRTAPCMSPSRATVHLSMSLVQATPGDLRYAYNRLSARPLFQPELTA
jgi:hypothetical protein